MRQRSLHDCTASAQVAKAVIGLVVTGHFPLNHHPARLAIEDMERQLLGWESISRTLSISQSLVFIWTTVAVSVVVSYPAWGDAFLKGRQSKNLWLREKTHGRLQNLLHSALHRTCILLRVIWQPGVRPGRSLAYGGGNSCLLHDFLPTWIVAGECSHRQTL